MKPTIGHKEDQEVAEMAFLDFRDRGAEHVIELMRKKLAENFGVTVQGPHLTLRWKDREHHVEASFVCVSLQHSAVLTPHDPEWNK